MADFSASHPVFHQDSVLNESLSTIWKPCWLVLQGNHLLLYKDPQRKQRSGRIRLSESTVVVVKDRKEKKGFSFVLKNDKKQTTKFKCQTENQRNLWIAFIDGISSGYFEKSSNLTADQILSVETAMANWAMFNSGHQTSHDEGVWSVSSYTDSGGSIEDGGPIKNHKFYNEPPGGIRNQQTPSWFFDNCSRQLAERILEKGKDYGNVLMRQSVTFKDNGSYVISLRRETPTSCVYEHFEVIQAVAGYQINVENNHSPKKCLQDVMAYFMEVAGLHYTKPFTTNDLYQIGIHWPQYQSVIQSVEPSPGNPTKSRSAFSGQHKTWNQGKRTDGKGPSASRGQVSLTVFGRSSENPLREKSLRDVLTAPTSLREVLKYGEKSSCDESTDRAVKIQPVPLLPVVRKASKQTSTEAPIVAMTVDNPGAISSNPPPIPTAPTPNRILTKNLNERPLPSIPDNDQQPPVCRPKTMPPSTHSTPPKAHMINQTPSASHGSSSVIPTAPVAPSIPTAPPLVRPTPSRMHSDSLSPPLSPAPPPPPMPQPLVPPAPSRMHADPLSPPLPPPPPPMAPPPPTVNHLTPTPAPPPLPSSSARSPNIMQSPSLPPSAPPTASLLQAIKSNPKNMLKKVNIKSPPTAPKTIGRSSRAVPATKPKPMRRSSESDLHQHNTLHVSHSASGVGGIIEEAHPSVRDVKAIFDQRSVSQPPSNTREDNHNQIPDFPRESSQGGGRRRNLDHASTNASWEYFGTTVGHTDQSEYLNPLSIEYLDEPIYEDLGTYQNVESRLKSPFYNSSSPDRVTSNSLISNPEPRITPESVPGEYAPSDREASEGQSREDFKRRLEALMSGSVSPVKSPTSPVHSPVTPVNPQVNSPVPSTPDTTSWRSDSVHDEQDESIYSEPENR